MKSELKAEHVPETETRKIRKPLMEKKRRARINDSLETLKQILLESKAALKESGKKNGQRTAKLEKADILEMTVHYIQSLKKKLDQTKPKQPTFVKEEILIRPADSSCDRLKVGITLVPTRLGNGDIAFVIPPNVQEERKSIDLQENVWRPW